MKRISLFIAALALGLFATTAATCQKTPPTGPTGTDGGSGGIVSGVINCAEQGVHNAAIHIIDDVASALATGDYVSGLVALVKQFGEGAVDCAAAEIADTAGKHAAMDPLEATKAQRAKEWLASRPVTVSSLQKEKGSLQRQHRQGALTGDGDSGAPVLLEFGGSLSGGMCQCGPSPRGGCAPSIVGCGAPVFEI
jgi:hypothetical protein